MIELRAMRQEDIDGVMKIELQVCDFPWNYSIYSDCIKVGYSCWVLVEPEIEDEKQRVVGYGLLSIAANEAHILQLCIDPDYQRKGLGKRMMRHLMLEAHRLTAKSVYLEVRVSNQAAQNLYQKLGFSVIGHRKGYYPAWDGREDAIVLEFVFC